MTDALIEEPVETAKGWQPGDESCRLAYELVKSGKTWLEACTSAGVVYTTAQMRYRFRGLPSPRRVIAQPLGGRDAAARRAYDRSVAGEVAGTVAAEEGISYQFLRRWCVRQGWPAPHASRKLGAEIAAFISQE